MILTGSVLCDILRSEDENGYGPKGKQFIAHVEIPDEVRSAFEQLKTTYGKQVREANPLFASK